MDENRVLQLIRSEISQSDGRSQFKPNNVPAHTHNGNDSLLITYPFIVYAGYVSAAGVANLLPSGWVSSKLSTGVYRVVAQLPDGALFSFVASTFLSANKTFVNVSNSVSTPNVIQFNVYDDGGTARDCQFMFMLTVVNNRIASLPTYYGALIH